MARCSAKRLLKSSKVMGSPVDVRRRVKRRERLDKNKRDTLAEHDSTTYSGRMSDVRKSLAGGSSGSISRTGGELVRAARGTWLRFASDFLLETRANRRIFSG